MDEYTAITEAIHEYVQEHQKAAKEAKQEEAAARARERAAAAEAKTAAEAAAAEAVVAAEVAKADAATNARRELIQQKRENGLRRRIASEQTAFLMAKEAVAEAEEEKIATALQVEAAQNRLQEKNEELQKAKTLTVEQRAELNKLAADIPEILKSELDDAAKEKLKKPAENLDAARKKVMTFEQVKPLLRKIYIIALASAAGDEARVSDLQFIVAQEPLNSRLKYLMMLATATNEAESLLYCVKQALQGLQDGGETVDMEVFVGWVEDFITS